MMALKSIGPILSLPIVYVDQGKFLSMQYYPANFGMKICLFHFCEIQFPHKC